MAVRPLSPTLMHNHIGRPSTSFSPVHSPKLQNSMIDQSLLETGSAHYYDNSMQALSPKRVLYNAVSPSRLAFQKYANQSTFNNQTCMIIKTFPSEKWGYLIACILFALGSIDLSHLDSLSSWCMFPSPFSECAWLFSSLYFSVGLERNSYLSTCWACQRICTDLAAPMPFCPVSRLETATNCTLSVERI